MRTLYRYLRGFLLVRLSGFSPERFFNLCTHHDIEIWNMRQEENQYLFCISLQSFRTLKPILRKSGTKIRICRRYGIPFWLFRYHKRKLFFGGIVAAIFLLFYLSGFIWNITVSGNRMYSDERILRYLAENGVASGSKCKDIDCDALETALRTDFKGISWVSVSLEGTSLTVELSEGRNVEEEPEEEELSGPTDLIAAKDGIIYSIVTRAGTPLVKNGVSVAAGDVLVSGRMELYNDAGEAYAYEYANADADIDALCEYPYSEQFSMSYEDREFTGRETKALRICVGTQSFAFGRLHKFEQSEMIRDMCQLKLGTNFYLPVIFEKVTTYEYETKKKMYSEEEAKQIAENDLDKFCEKLMQNGIQIMQKNVMIEIVDSKCQAKGTVTVIESIAKTTECEVLDFTDEQGQTDEAGEEMSDQEED